MEDTKTLMAVASSSSSHSDETTPRTIVHEIMDSKLPAAQKETERVFEDVSTVAGAGFETTGSALRLVLFHVFSNPDILQRLRDELVASSVTSHGESPDAIVDLRTLEQLPYLTSTLMEGLRLSPAIGTRMARVAPDRDLFYDEWRIPAGTPVGMTLVLMHTDEALYPDPFRFNPDRWMDPEARKNDKTFAPFSRGTRNCLGMQ